MFRNKNYLKYYKNNYLKHSNAPLKRSLVIFFTLLMFITLFMVGYVFIQMESSNFGYKDETSHVVNQAVSVKKKKLRTDFTQWNRSCDWNLLIINNVNEIPRYFAPRLSLHADIDVDERILFSLNEMVHDANETGLRLWVSSGYRSNERQEQLFRKEVEESLASGLAKEEALDSALKAISLPGCNEHNSGLSVDFNAAGEEFCTTPEYEWLLENSVNYGFILRYSREKEAITGRTFEPAHFRYVGDEHAKIIKSQNLCFEEYISNLMK